VDGLEALIGPVSAPALVVVAGAVLAAGFVRGFVGFGASLTIVMVLSVVFGPTIAVPVANLTGLPSTVQLLPTAVRHAERSFVVPFGLTTFVAAPFGTWVLVSLDPTLMKIAISLFVLAVVAMLSRGWRLSAPPNTTMLVGSGTASGLLQGAAGVGGPPAVAIALSRPGTPERQRANVIGAVTSLALCGLLPLWYHDLLTPGVVLLSIVLMPFYFGGSWLGARFFSERGRDHFRPAALMILAIIGMVTLGLALHDL